MPGLLNSEGVSATLLQSKKQSYGSWLLFNHNSKEIVPSPRDATASQSKRNVASCEPVSLAARFDPMTDWSQAIVGDHFQSSANDPNGTDKAAPNLRLLYGMSPEFAVDALQQTLLEANLARLSVLVKNKLDSIG